MPIHPDYPHLHRYVVILLFLICAVMLGLVVFRSKKKPLDFSDTFPQTDKVEHIGLIITFETGEELKLYPGRVHEFGTIHLGAARSATVQPWLPSNPEGIDYLLAKQWLISAGKKTYLQTHIDDLNNVMTVSSTVSAFETMDANVPPAELFVCFEAIDPQTRTTYQIDLTFKHLEVATKQS